MADQDTVIVVGATRVDEYGNLWVTPQGRGEEVKIAKKREKLHPLFAQGKAVMCHWETYMDKPYISGAKLVEGELPPPVKPGTVPVPPETQAPPAPQAVGMLTKEIGDMIRAEKLSVVFGPIIANKLTEWYRSQALGISRVSWDGKDLPLPEMEPEDIPF